MARYIESIKINEVFHLSDITIPIADDAFPHLILTGKNGSGKTSVLNAVADFLEKVSKDTNKFFESYRKDLAYWKEQLQKKDADKLKSESQIAHYENRIQDLFGKVELTFTDVDDLIRSYQKGEFIIAFYQANRKAVINEPKNPTKPKIKEKWNAKDAATIEFLNFLSDLKIQEALARNENLQADADQIRLWFEDFQQLLRQIFQADNLSLDFNYKDYSFKIRTGGKEFKFTQLSDGFAAVLDIVIDLILKMQVNGKLIRSYQQRGIVLIDEIETHLHLEMQRVIMPLLTSIFPNIQFIITTHSPFVLSSLNTATAFDLEHQEPITDLTEYSYSALAEGYFGVNSDSSYAGQQLKRLEELFQKAELSAADRKEAKSLIADFETIAEPLAPALVGQYQQLKTNYTEAFKRIKGND